MSTMIKFAYLRGVKYLSRASLLDTLPTLAIANG